MGIGLSDPLQADPDALDQGASTPISPWASYSGQFTSAAHDLSFRALNLASDLTATRDSPQISAEDANQRYGIDGQLRFNQPISENDAAFRHSMARGAQWQSILAQRSNASPLLDMGASFAGSLFDPLGVALMAGTDGAGTLAKGALGLDAAGEAANAARSGFLANGASVGGELMRTAAEGAAYNAPFVGLDAYLHHSVGDDMSMGEAAKDLALGAIFHTGVHYAGKLFGHPPGGETGVSGEDATGAPASSPSPPIDGMPDAVQALPESSRLGGWLKAVDDLSDDRPVDVGQYVDREAAPPTLDDLTERDAAPQTPGRWLHDDTAVTPRGSEIPVRYGLVEMGDLVTSHDDDFNANPAFPAELQPRDRGMLGAMARNYQLEQELNPKLLMSDVNAAGGAPMIAPDGVVESGNGRTIALRRSADQGRTDAYPRYKAALEAAGYDATGMTKPMLVRMRSEPMQGAQRASLAREMNADVTERMSAPEQAMADARRIDDADLSTVENPLTDRAFQRAFLAKVAPDQVNQLVDKSGLVSVDGARRIRVAVIAKAYGDPALADPGSAVGSDGLAAAAPQWARMRAMASSGEIPPDLDITANLSSAMDLVRAAKADGQALGAFLAERFGQLDAFAGDAISPETEAFLRILYRDEAFKKPRDPARVAWALNDYAKQAVAVTPGPDLFGASADGSTARQILAGLNDRFARGDAGAIDLRAPGKAAESSGVEPAAGVALIDVRPPGENGRGEDGSAVRQGDEQGAGQARDRSGGDPGAAEQSVPNAERLIASDPELKALQDDTARMAAEHGLALDPPPENEKPDNVVKALHAAASCLIGAASEVFG